MPDYPVTVVAIKEKKIRRGEANAFTDWIEYDCGKIRAKSPHLARRQALLNFLEQGYRVKETRIENSYA